MAITLKKLSLNQLTGSAVAQYTVPAATTTRVTEMVVCNTDTVDRTYTVSYVPSAGTQGATNAIFSAVVIGAGETHVHSMDSVLSTGDFISALASAAAHVNLYISGAELT